jgi:NADP-dependent 3-hydroxy acid dehydrogenase YdfG
MTDALAGRSVLVTGASSGIGAATAVALAGAGARVLATGRNATALGALAPHGIETLAGDLRDPGFVLELAARAEDCDVLVANAGGLKHAPFLESRREDWRAVFELNVLATLDLVQRIATHMATRRSGHIVLLSSLLARRVARNTLVYAASKHAIAAIAAGLRLELEQLGIRVTEIAPGLVRTGIFRNIDHAGARDAYAALEFDFLQPEDVAAAILGAVTARPGACADLIELRPVGQP